MILGEIKKAWANAMRCSLDCAFTDVIGCGDDELVGYVMKELKKASSCEKAVKQLERNEGTKEQKEAAQKKVLAFYHADKHKMRLLNVSRGIGAGGEPEEGEMPEADLIMNVIKEPPRTPQVLYTCIVTRGELLKMIKHEEISPYTGTVDPISKEYEVMMQIFEERYGISKVLGNKEELERVIAEQEKRKEERKIVKLKTKIIAQEAIRA
jgi:hypothetical protein